MTPKRSLIVSILLAVTLLAGPMAWAQGNSKLANLKPRLDALKAFAEKLPPRHRNALSGAVQNLISFADTLDRMPAGLNRAASHPSGSAGSSSGGGNSNVVQVSDPSTDFAFSLQTGFTQSETSTAWCGPNVVVGFNDSGSIPETAGGPGGLSSAGVARSGDQGHTFQDLGFLNPGTDSSAFVAGDPVLACASPNTFYYSSLFETGFFPNLFSEVSVSKSTDGGSTFANPVAAISKPNIDPNTFQFLHFLDKDWMAADPTNPDRIFVTYTDFDGSGAICGTDVNGFPIFRNAIELVRSTDGGATWSSPVVLEQICGFSASASFSQIALGPGGEVYVAWEFFNTFTTGEIRIRRSVDHAVTFAPALKVDNVVLAGDTFTLQGLFRQGADISLAVDRSGTASNGNVYIAWQDGRNLQIPSFTISGTYAYADILLRKSSDGGATWSPVVRVNDNPEPLPDGRGTDQYQPGVAVDGWGKVGVCFYDRRHDPQNFMIDRYCAISTDAGTTWLNRRQSSPSWSPIHATDFQVNPFYMGDYDSLASDFTKTTPGFIGAFQISNTRGGISGNSIPVPNQDVVAVKVQ
jgi:hypothetical protein